MKFPTAAAAVANEFDTLTRSVSEGLFGFDTLTRSVSEGLLEPLARRFGLVYICTRISYLPQRKLTRKMVIGN